MIAHSVSLMGVQAGAVERVLDRDPDKAREALRSIQSTARESVGELRRLLGILRAHEEPLGISPQPGLAALSALVEDSRTAGLSVSLAVDGAARALPAGVELSAYRVVQEALTNVRKHAPGSSAQVRLCYRADEVELVVINSASGTANGGPSTPTQGSGHGLVGMRERVRSRRHLPAGQRPGRVVAPSPDGGRLVPDDRECGRPPGPRWTGPTTSPFSSWTTSTGTLRLSVMLDWSQASRSRPGRPTAGTLSSGKATHTPTSSSSTSACPASTA